MSVWYNRRISPGSINLAQTIDILIIAVVGGLYRLEGAWVGALVYALIDNYSREWVPDVGQFLGPARFNTIIGLVFLIIVLLSPGGHPRAVGAGARRHPPAPQRRRRRRRRAPWDRGRRAPRQQALSSDVRGEVFCS